ncbi:hypothetical protein P256_00278 [Acinetobacter nectaris CIP 110549]|uniref:Uncharacterized protein n=1 Tax=Acinetobacter nectaris CIP 110549 TaxID=1392540 RepID=V2TGP3_9GAMM|nr:hypothetical protein [Acinetobacter nectaris]ESK41288.1 hypothetical protein P256_00278 [Acinetobacter nectaris CIP 110549]
MAKQEESIQSSNQDKSSDELGNSNKKQSLESKSLIISYDSDKKDEILKYLKSKNIEVVYNLKNMNIIVITIAESDVKQTVNSLENFKGVLDIREDSHMNILNN